MTLHAAAVAALSDWPAPDAEQERLRRRYLACLARDPRATYRTGHPEHLTASTLVLSADGSEVLLTLHARAGRWFQLGGHCEEGDGSLLEAARREALEESGIDGLRLDPEPLRLDAHAVPFCGDTGVVHHLDVWFLAVAPAGASPTVSEESHDVRWWPLDALPDDAPAWRQALDLAAARRAGQSTSSPGGGSSWRAADHPSR